MATNSTTTARAPQDRKPTKAAKTEAAQVRFDEIEGHDLLRPFSQVKGSDQVRLLGRLTRLGLIDDAEDGDSTADLSGMDLEEIADLIDYVAERFAIDVQAFEEFTSGRGGYERAMTLAVAYAGELGNADD